MTKTLNVMNILFLFQHLPGERLRKLVKRESKQNSLQTKFEHSKEFINLFSPTLNVIEKKTTICESVIRNDHIEGKLNPYFVFN